MQVDFKDVIQYGWAACLAFVPRIVSAYRTRVGNIDKKLEDIAVKHADETKKLTESIVILSTQMDVVLESIKQIHKKLDEQQAKTEGILVDLARKKDI